jgi:hypothetical protein
VELIGFATGLVTGTGAPRLALGMWPIRFAPAKLEPCLDSALVSLVCLCVGCIAAAFGTVDAEDFVAGIAACVSVAGAAALLGIELLAEGTALFGAGCAAALLGIELLAEGTALFAGAALFAAGCADALAGVEVLTAGVARFGAGCAVAGTVGVALSLSCAGSDWAAAIDAESANEHSTAVRIAGRISDLLR